VVQHEEQDDTAEQRPPDARRAEHTAGHASRRSYTISGTSCQVFGGVPDHTSTRARARLARRLTAVAAAPRPLRGGLQACDAGDSTKSPRFTSSPSRSMPASTWRRPSAYI